MSGSSVRRMQREGSRSSPAWSPRAGPARCWLCVGSVRPGWRRTRYLDTVVWLDRIPLTDRGKTDRAELERLVNAPPQVGRNRYVIVPIRSPAAACASTAAGSLEVGTRMNVWKPVELALAYGARAAWPAFQAVNRRFEGRAFQPKWAPGPLKKRRERTRPQFGWPRTTDSLCPTCVREARARILAGRPVGRVPRQQSTSPRSPRRSSSATAGSSSRRPARRTARSPTRWPSTPHFWSAWRTCSPAATSTPSPSGLHDHGTSSITPRPRRGADDRPDEPLQHDVRPVLHGCQPGRLRPRAVARRREEAPGRRGEHQAAAADDRAVLGRGTDHLADLPRCRPVRARGRLLQHPGGDQRHPFRAGSRVRAAGARGRDADRLPAIRRRQRRGQRAPQGRQPVRREAARDRGAARGRRSTSASSSRSSTP